MPHPAWIKKVRLTGNHRTKGLLRRHRLSTVCEEARCPNRGECFSRPTATFLILGDVCTRGCRFCAVKKGKPSLPDPEEPERVAIAAKEMGLRYVVVTSVTRDDLPDRGASQFARTITTLKRYLPEAKVEVLTPDFGGKKELLYRVIQAGPDVFNHNVETVPRLYPMVRPQADYRRSLNLLEEAVRMGDNIPVKSGLMVGLGETLKEVIQVMKDLRSVGCSILTIGQYLQPTKKNLPVVKYIPPEVFEELRLRAIEMGFTHVASGPMVRSSMNAEEMYEQTREV